ncbi:DoxX family membrane protein [Microbispora hainanensis]|uniref:DoxX family membrane protein n=2 Tax=Microbispora hainanensis TaxID=568844 RepID=A0A544YS23_9ACTN|nr:DoxX family membrane protein [Microbispora hainanensis]
MKAREVPGRVATGAYILHSGLEKWNGGDEQAAGLHGTAANAFPFLKNVPPRRFLKLLSAAEIATGVALLTPFVPAAVAGAALTGFSGSLVALYLRTPALHKPGSIWPTPAGVGISKDVWMLGIGLGLLADAATRRRDG